MICDVWPDYVIQNMAGSIISNMTSISINANLNQCQSQSATYVRKKERKKGTLFSLCFRNGL
jgi:hypothetical protein